MAGGPAGDGATAAIGATADKARAAFVAAMDNWDESAADAAVAGLARTAPAKEIFELFYRYGAHNQRPGGVTGDRRPVADDREPNGATMATAAAGTWGGKLTSTIGCTAVASRSRGHRKMNQTGPGSGSHPR